MCVGFPFLSLACLYLAGVLQHLGIGCMAGAAFNIYWSKRREWVMYDV